MRRLFKGSPMAERKPASKNRWIIFMLFIILAVAMYVSITYKIINYSP